MKQYLEERELIQQHMKQLFDKNNIWITSIVISLLVHFSIGLSIHYSKPEVPKKLDPVKIKIVTTKKPKPVIRKKPPKIEKPKAKPKLKKKKKKKPKKKKIQPKTVRKKTAKTNKKVKAIQGLSKKSFSKNSKSTFKAPVGNTLMVEDKGIRKNKVEDLNVDLSKDAELIISTFTKPQYTDEALDIELEGKFTLEVFINKDGNVEDVELPRKIGFGMDERLKSAIKLAKFRPRQNKVGSPIPGWAIIKVYLTIP